MNLENRHLLLSQNIVKTSKVEAQFLIVDFLINHSTAINLFEKISGYLVEGELNHSPIPDNLLYCSFHL